MTTNISGGHPYWDNGAQQIFVSPSNLEEGLLALELRSVLETATKNQLAVVQRLASGPLDMSIFGLPMDFGVLLGTVSKLAERDAHFALKVKLAMAEIARATTQQSLADFIGEHCLTDPAHSEEYCSRF